MNLLVVVFSVCYQNHRRDIAARSRQGATYRRRISQKTNQKERLMTPALQYRVVKC